MKMLERMAYAMDRFYDRMRSPRAIGVADATPEGSLDDLGGHKYCVVVAYKKTGEAVPSPVWFGTGDGRLFFQTGEKSAKLKRIKRQPEVRVAPSTARGRPRGAPFRGTARVVDPAGEDAAERILQRNYGLGRRLYSLFVSQAGNVYVEVTPAPPA
jgi:PPOX class probable F420-dependent enzyme